MFCEVWDRSNSKLHDRQNKQRASSKSCKFEIKILANPGLTERWTKFWTTRTTHRPAHQPRLHCPSHYSLSRKRNRISPNEVNHEDSMSHNQTGGEVWGFTRLFIRLALCGSCDFSPWSLRFMTINKSFKPLVDPVVAARRYPVPQEHFLDKLKTQCTAHKALPVNQSQAVHDKNTWFRFHLVTYICLTVPIRRELAFWLSTVWIQKSIRREPSTLQGWQSVFGIGGRLTSEWKRR